ncbi:MULTISPECIES: cupin domain-containing protein [unclassified Lysobacter]|uniref:cupin domain-containing protein n=1 Tax=unclassified Lysobacter TaxID=2635362 RepID=UPI0006F9B9DF|nr:MULTISPECIES: cupin domain-containing protein [unclassified Lysobacter]KQZ65271.1 hypothetical protein ASD53_18355 [Lysobacter sp. Root559]KRC36795.1 hypothetical protein ASE10_06780 [Lysobacter sp. Root76]KRD66891.1 hypothetical protein ASE45_16435 [Lysobacter sp. Root96]
MSDRLRRIAILTTLVLCSSAARAGEPVCSKRSDSYVEQARGLAVAQPGPHEGAGTTTAYPFFEQAAGFDLVFRQRALHRGASIGEHRNDKDEIYYVLSGRGELMLDDARREVGPGDAVLTRKGSTHGLKQLGDEDLVIVVVYRRAQPVDC